MSLPSFNSLHLTLSEIQPQQEFKGKVIIARLKVKSRSHHWCCRPIPPTNAPNKNQHLTSHSFRDTNWTSFSQPTAQMPIWKSSVKSENNTCTVHKNLIRFLIHDRTHIAVTTEKSRETICHICKPLNRISSIYLVIT